MLSRFAQLLKRARRQPAAPVELDLVQQMVLLTLARFGPQPYARLADEVTANRPATPADIVNGVLKLETAGVIERRPEQGVRQPDRRYQLTARGKRIARFVPSEPRSVMEFSI